MSVDDELTFEEFTKLMSDALTDISVKNRKICINKWWKMIGEMSPPNGIQSRTVEKFQRLMASNLMYTYLFITMFQYGHDEILTDNETTRKRNIDKSPGNKET